MKKKKILFIASEPAPGMIPYAATIMNVLADSGEFEIYSITYSSGKHSYENILNEKVHSISLVYPKSRAVRLFYKFYPVLMIKTIHTLTKSVRMDFIHFLTGDFSFSLYTLFHKIDKRYVYTVHDLYPHIETSKNFFYYLISCGNKVMRKRIPTLISSSRSQVERLIELYPRKYILFTHFPSLVTEPVKQGKKKVPELKDVKNYILFFGTVDRYKGVDILIDTYERSPLLKRYKLVIAGRGLEYKNSDIIRINRFIQDEEMADLFGSSSVVVYPYRSATMSGVLSLAYFFRKRVVVSDIPFFKEYENKDTVLFRNGDMKDLESKLIEVLSFPLEGMNMERYYNYYSEQTLIADYKNLYK